jgi:hypothetical protein
VTPVEPTPEALVSGAPVVEAAKPVKQKRVYNKKAKTSDKKVVAKKTPKKSRA